MHEILLSTKRDIYEDTCFYGSVFLANKETVYKSVGKDKKTICFMRSLAKPIQASILFDCDITKYLNDKEIAIFAGSHSASPKHIQILNDVLAKFSLNPDYLCLEAMEPLDKREFDGIKTKLHNNCSGKHTMMAIACQYYDFDYGYCDFNHPLQKMIKEKQEELSGYKSDILTYDGCSTPLWGLPFENIIKAYFNLFHDKKYNRLIYAILNNPDIYGGFNRLDSDIIKMSEAKLFSKVGAGGLVLVYNFEQDEILLIKLAQDNNEVRKLILLDILNKIGWLKSDIEQFIYNQKKQIVAKYYYNFAI